MSLMDRLKDMADSEKLAASPLAEQEESGVVDYGSMDGEYEVGTPDPVRFINNEPAKIDVEKAQLPKMSNSRSEVAEMLFKIANACEDGLALDGGDIELLKKAISNAKTSDWGR